MLHLLIAFSFTFLIVAALLLLAVRLGGLSRDVRKDFGFFYEEADEARFRPDPTTRKGKKRREAEKKKRSRQNAHSGSRRNQRQSCTEMAMLIQKIDERRRVVDSTGRSKLYDEYFELIFETRKGEMIRLVTTRAAFKEVPFHQEGALTYRRGTFIRFKYSGGTISENESPML